MEFTSSFSTFLPSNCWDFRRQPYGDQFLTQSPLILSSTWCDFLDYGKGMENYSALRAAFDSKHFVMLRKYCTPIPITKMRLSADITHHKHHIYTKIFLEIETRANLKKKNNPKAHVRHVSANGTACWPLSANIIANINFMLLWVLRLKQLWLAAWVPWKCTRRVQNELSAAIFGFIPNRNNSRQIQTYFQSHLYFKSSRLFTENRCAKDWSCIRIGYNKGIIETHPKLN